MLKSSKGDNTGAVFKILKVSWKRGNFKKWACWVCWIQLQKMGSVAAVDSRALQHFPIHKTLYFQLMSAQPAWCWAMKGSRTTIQSHSPAPTKKISPGGIGMGHFNQSTYLHPPQGLGVYCHAHLAPRESGWLFDVLMELVVAALRDHLWFSLRRVSKIPKMNRSLLMSVSINTGT